APSPLQFEACGHNVQILVKPIHETQYLPAQSRGICHPTYSLSNFRNDECRMPNGPGPSRGTLSPFVIRHSSSSFVDSSSTGTLKHVPMGRGARLPYLCSANLA